MKWERVQFATVAEVVAAHDYEIGETGGTPGILKLDGLESAVMAPQATYGGQPLLETIADIAAAYVYYLSRSHVFADGNKRTSIIVALSFLDVNGFTVTLSDPSGWADIVQEVATGLITREQLAEVFADVMGDWGKIE